MFVSQQVKKYPVFLKSAGITHTAWEVMKLKFIEKLILSLQGKPSRFVVSFMGSSVTAGHDSPFNVSFPNLVGILMNGPLAAAGEYYVLFLFLVSCFLFLAQYCASIG